MMGAVDLVTIHDVFETETTDDLVERLPVSLISSKLRVTIINVKIEVHLGKCHMDCIGRYYTIVTYT